MNNKFKFILLKATRKVCMNINVVRSGIRELDKFSLRLSLSLSRVGNFRGFLARLFVDAQRFKKVCLDEGMNKHPCEMTKSVTAE